MYPGEYPDSEPNWWKNARERAAAHMARGNIIEIRHERRDMLTAPHPLHPELGVNPLGFTPEEAYFADRWDTLAAPWERDQMALTEEAERRRQEQLCVERLQRLRRTGEPRWSLGETPKPPLAMTKYTNKPRNAAAPTR